ncbi:hypothetical protein [Streptomyces sp. NPDC001194]
MFEPADEIDAYDRQQADLEHDDRSFIWVFGDLDDPQTDADQPA